MTKRGRMKNPAVPTEGRECGAGDLDGIFIHRDNAEFGPYSREEVFAALFRGEFGNDDYARQGEDAEWRLLSEVMKAGTPMLFPRVEEISVASYAVELPEYLRGAPEEIARVGVVREVRSWRSRFESVDFAGILKLGAIGMILSFAVTCFILKKQGLIFTTAVQPAPVHLQATPTPILIAAATPTPKPVTIAVIAATPQPLATPPPVVAAATPAGAPVREIVLPKVNGIDSTSLWVANTARTVGRCWCYVSIPGRFRAMRSPIPLGRRLPRIISWDWQRSHSRPIPSSYARISQMNFQVSAGRI